MICISFILKHSAALTLFVLGLNVCMAQSAKFDLSNGNEAYEKKEYDTALKKYSNALDLDPNYAPAEFNTANTYYRQEKMDEAIREFRRIAKTSENGETQAKAYHNLGNAYLKNSKLKEAIEAYKNSLRINPDDHETRYNLAFAQRMLKQNPQQQEQKQDEKKQDKEDKEDKEKQDESKEDESKENKKDGDEPSDKNEEGDKDKDEQEQPDGEPKEDEMSKEDAERLLQMLEDEEKETQEDLMKKKVKVKKVNIEKDW